MGRTAPAPNMPPIPGMCPSVAILGGGGDGGGGRGRSGGAGGGGAGGGRGLGGDATGGDRRGAPDYQRYPECGYESHPVDVVTGRAFTHPIVDLELPGPLPLTFARMYSSAAAERDTGLGFGWAHSFGWEVEVGRRGITVWNEQGVAVDFPLLDVGAEVIGPWGWLLRREAWGFVVDVDDEVLRVIALSENGGHRFRLTAIEDRNCNRIALSYQDGRLAEVVDSAGRRIRVRATREGRIAALDVQNAAMQGRWIPMSRYDFDEHGNLARATDADGYSASYAYDDDHRLVRDTDRTGLTFHFRYDAAGRCVESWGDYPGREDPSLAGDVPATLADGLTPARGVHHCRFEYYDAGYTEVVNSVEVRHYFGNLHGTLDKYVIGSGTVTCSYDERGFLLSRIDERGERTSYRRDERGRLAGVTDPLGRTSQATLDAHGLPVEVMDPAGATTGCERDGRGNVLHLVNAAGAVTSYTYEERGLPVRVVLPDGGAVAVRYDAHGNPVEMVQPAGAVWRWRWDYLGRMQEEVDPLGARTGYTWSDRGDLLSVVEPDGATTRYRHDGERHLVEVTDPLGFSTSATYGGYHRLCDRKDEIGNTVRYRYDREGQLVEVHNERGEVHRLRYAAGGRLFEETTFDGRKWIYKHDLAGDVIEVRDNLGRRTRLERDAAGQIVRRELPDMTEERFLYDARGDLIEAIGPDATITFERDLLGQIVREAITAGDLSAHVDVAYDSMARRAARRTSRGHAERIARDAMGHATRTRLGEAFDIGHESDLLGRELARELPGGGRLESAFDAVGQLAARLARARPARPRVGPGEPAWVGPSPTRITAERRYQHDARGSVREVAGRRTGPEQLAHDACERLVARLSEAGTSEAFHYDEAGNRVESGAEGEVYGPGGRLLRKGNTTYRWDAAGRLVEKLEGADRLWRYRWNGKDLLEKVLAPDGIEIELRYDPFCRRVSKRVSRPPSSGALPALVETTRYVWDGDLLVHAIRERAAADGDPIVEERTFCFEDGSWAPLAHRDVILRGEGREEGEWLSYLNDGIGTPEALIRPDGTVAGEIERSAWGKVTPSRPGEATTPFGFAGQYADEETGLLYNRFRYYDPEAGLFLSPDPLGLDGDLHPFAFVPDPTSWIDPLGLARTPRMKLGDNLERKRRAELRAQGYELLPGKVGSNNGIDIVAVKRDSSGTIVAMRLEECKANGAKRGTSAAGPQLSEPWLKDVLAKMRARKGCTQRTAQAIDDARKAGVVEKFIVRGKQGTPGRAWDIKPPKKIRD